MKRVPDKILSLRAADGTVVQVPEALFYDSSFLGKARVRRRRVVFVQPVTPTVAAPKPPKPPKVLTLEERHARLSARGERRRTLASAEGRTMRAYSSHRNVVACPHCGREGERSPMMRWHFDRCRHK